MGQSVFVAYAYAFNITALLIARALFKPKASDTRVNDFIPTTLATQGAFVPLLIGRRRIGPVFAWAGDRTSFPVTSTVRTKGSKKKKQTTGQVVYSEAGWHLLCVGPASRLNRIYQDGKVIWEGPTSPDTDPSGSTLTMQDGTGDTCQIYWGESDQDVNTFLGAGSRVGINSRWPLTCYIVWTRKTLGPSPRWPLLEYDIECESKYSLEDTSFTPVVKITGSTGNTVLEYRSFAFLSGYVASPLLSFVIATAGYYKLRDTLFALRWATHRNGVLLTSNPSLEDYVGTAEVHWRGSSIYDMPCPISPSAIPGDWTNTAEADELDNTGATASGVRTISKSFDANFSAAEYLTPGTYTFRVKQNSMAYNRTAGNACSVYYLTATLVRVLDPATINPMTALGQVLFNEFPYGLGLDADLFDLDSMVSVAATLETEGVSGVSIIAKDGEEALAILGGILQDAGVFVYREPSTGLYTFGALRQGTAQEVPEDMTVGREPEVDVIHADRGTTRVIFSFEDQERAFRESNITLDEDGLADRLAHHRAKKVPLPTVVDPVVANVVANRRSQEEFGVSAAFKFKMNRGAIALYPGQIVEVAGIEDVLRVQEVKPDGIGSEVEVTLIPDFYGSATSSKSGTTGGGNSSTGTPVAADDQASFFEVPAHLLAQGEPITLAVARVRNHDQVTRADVYLSLDDTTYQLVGTAFDIHTGGELLEAVASDDPYYIEQGPTFTIAGPPDDDALEDLSADATNWRLGRQGAIIGDEIFFVQKITALGGDTYRIDGLLRARYDTERSSHAIGDKVYLFTFDGIDTVTDIMLAPGATVYMKAQPWAATGLSLASVTAVSKTIKGKGLVPMKPGAFRVTGPYPGSPCYGAGQDVEFAWGYRSTQYQKTGAGMQPSGSAVAASGVQGEFELIFKDATDTVVRTVSGLTTPSYVYDNADLQADLGGETDFSVELRNVNGGYRSDPVTLSIVAL